MNLGVPQIIWIVLICLNLGINLAKHGESKSKEKYSFWTALIGVGINFWIVYAGGFFK